MFGKQRQSTPVGVQVKEGGASGGGLQQVVPGVRDRPSDLTVAIWGGELGGSRLDADSGTGCCEHPGKRRAPGQGQDRKGQWPRGQECLQSVLGVPI